MRDGLLAISLSNLNPQNVLELLLETFRMEHGGGVEPRSSVTP